MEIVHQQLIDKSNSSQRTRNAWRLNIPSFKYVNYKRSFKLRAATLWNNLSPRVKELNSIDSFKNVLKKSDVLERINFGHNATGLARDLDYIYITNFNW